MMLRKHCFWVLVLKTIWLLPIVLSQDWIEDLVNKTGSEADKLPKSKGMKLLMSSIDKFKDALTENKDMNEMVKDKLETLSHKMIQNNETVNRLQKKHRNDITRLEDSLKNHVDGQKNKEQKFNFTITTLEDNMTIITQRQEIKMDVLKTNLTEKLQTFDDQMITIKEDHQEKLAEQMTILTNQLKENIDKRFTSETKYRDLLDEKIANLTIQWKERDEENKFLEKKYKDNLNEKMSNLTKELNAKDLQIGQLRLECQNQLTEKVSSLTNQLLEKGKQINTLKQEFKDQLIQLEKETAEKLEEINKNLPNQIKEEVRPECSLYTTLNETSRSTISHWKPYGTYCDRMDKPEEKSHRWVGEGWYRYQEPAGTIMPEKPPGQGYCGTVATGWLNGTHPTSLGDSIEAKFCFNYDNKDCWNHTTGKVTNCGNFFVYFLPEPYVCLMRYCAS